MNFTAIGHGQPCCDYPVLPAPPEPGVQVYRCDDRIYHYGTGRGVIINPDASCPCDTPLATESTTWGRVKSLYH